MQENNSEWGFRIVFLRLKTCSLKKKNGYKKQNTQVG